MSGLEEYVRKWAEGAKQEHAARTEAIVEKIYTEAKDLATSAPGLKNAESGLGMRTGTLLRSISKRQIIEPDGSVAFEIYYDKNICNYAEYIENGTRKMRPFKILASAYDNILGEGKK
jgi:hypothetical protein